MTITYSNFHNSSGPQESNSAMSCFFRYKLPSQAHSHSRGPYFATTIPIAKVLFEHLYQLTLYTMTKKPGSSALSRQDENKEVTNFSQNESI